jgi:hypothetical protein
VNARFKIDLASGTYEPFALFWKMPTFFGGRWVKLDDFKTREAAKAHYELVKDLPEYLP